MDIEYVTADATAPTVAGPKILAHVCNDRGAWGKGFVIAISRRWPQPARNFKAWYQAHTDFQLGAVQFVPVEVDFWVANMVAQHGLKPKQGQPLLQYDALATCLDRLALEALEWQASVHMPRIGCGLAGGDWTKIEPMIREKLLAHGVAVTVYDFAKPTE